MNIKFTNLYEMNDLEPPKPASNFIPDWYKNTDSYVGGKKIPIGDGSTSATIKRCIPVFDAITAGYIITLPADLYVSIKDGEQFFEWSALNLIKFHPIIQAPEHPAKNQHAYPKIMNPWGIKTPKGYSTLFVPPMHRESVFTILPGIVDTDTYIDAVNFPMTVNDPNFEGYILKGTPIVQVIPFKRESWKMQFGTKEDMKETYLLGTKLSSKFFDRYKSMFWSKKEYK